MRRIYVGRSAYRPGEDGIVPGRDVSGNMPDGDVSGNMDAIAAMSHQEMWAEMASMRSRWNDVEFLEDMPDEIRERYEALVDAYDRAAPAGARRPDALGRSVV
jgi:hypothetical protein